MNEKDTEINDPNVTKTKIKRTIFLFVIVAYMLVVTMITGYYSLDFLVRYVWRFEFGLVLTETGVSTIIPLVPLTRLLLAVLGVVGAIYLLLRRKRGLWISLCWALLQIPSVTIWFGNQTNTVLYGLGALNLQVFTMGFLNCHFSPCISAFTNIKSVLSTCHGVNFVGVIIFLALFVVWLQNNERAVHYLKNSSLYLVRRSIVIFQSVLFIALFAAIVNFTIQNYFTRPDIRIHVGDISCPLHVLFYTKDYSFQTVILNVDVTFQNKGKSPTTIRQTYLRLQILPQLWMTDLPLQEDYYPGGSDEGKIWDRGNHIPYSQRKLWAIIPAGFRKGEFKSFRLEGEDQTIKNLSFIVPLQDIKNREMDILDLKFEGVVFAETVGGDICKSKEFRSDFSFSRKNIVKSSKISVPLGNHGDFVFDVFKRAPERD
jgi:hypothetical protein